MERVERGIEKKEEKKNKTRSCLHITADHSQGCVGMETHTGADSLTFFSILEEQRAKISPQNTEEFKSSNYIP